MKKELVSLLLRADKHDIARLIDDCARVDCLPVETVEIDDETFILTRIDGGRMRYRSTPRPSLGDAWSGVMVGWLCGHLAAPDLDEYGDGVCPTCGQVEPWYTPYEIFWEEDDDSDR